MEPLSPKDPKNIGDYTLIGRLGSGGMGVVYIAANGPETVALKVVRESLLDDPAQSTRFAREIETLQKIDSPYVARILDSGITNEKAWYATEFVNGPDLKSLVEAKGSLSLEHWAKLASGLASGLAAIHEKGIIHRDIKPANIIMAESGPKIIDFGIAQISDATSVTSTGLVSGSPAWFSPEQIEGKSLTTASDLFSAGSVLTYAATGRSPWGHDSTMTKASVFGILAAEPNLSGATPEQLRIISALLEKDPTDRHFSKEISKVAGARTYSEPESAEVVQRKPIKSSITNLKSQPSKAKEPDSNGSNRKGFVVASVSVTVVLALIFGFNLIPSGLSIQPPNDTTVALNLTIGGLVPQTGALEWLGPPVEAAMLLAQKDINNSNSGVTVDLVFADEGDSSSSIELESARFLADSGASVVVGPLSSTRALVVFDYLTIEKEIVMISPSNSSRAFDNYDATSLYFRSSASDSQQGTVIADLMLADGASSFAVVAVEDPYARDLAGDIAERISRVDSRLDAPHYFEIPYGGSLSQSQLSSLLEISPDGIVLATYDETLDVVPQLVGSGIGPSRLYFADAAVMDYSADFPSGYLAGTKGTIPWLDPVFMDADFYDRLNSHWISEGNPELDLDYLHYAAEAYDAVISAALAALVSKSVTGFDIARILPTITDQYGEQEPCWSFNDCFFHTQDGKEIKYFGLTGPIGFSGGLSTGAKISVYQYGSDNSYLPIELRTTYRESDNLVLNTQ